MRFLNQLARAGAMRLRLRLEAPVDAADDIGGQTRTYALLGNLWGEVTPMQGDEELVSDRFEARITHRVTLRFRPDVTARMRLVAAARVFTIRAVFDPDGSRRRLVCLAEERAP